MKKIVVVLLLLSCFVVGFAETGYNGVNWDTSGVSIDFNEVETRWQITPEDELNTWSEIVLGERIIKSCCIRQNKFKGICYVINEKSVKELLTKLDQKKKIYEIRTDFINGLETSRLIAKHEKNGTLPNYSNDKKRNRSIIDITAYEYSTINAALECEYKGYKNLKKQKKSAPYVGTLYIYDYNDDTRIYITSGNVDGLAFVAYVPHAKDY